MLPETEVQEMMPQNEIVETMEINLDEEVEVKDSEADFNEISAPPSKGVYPFKWRLNLEKGGGQLSDGTEIPKGIAVGISQKKPFVGIHIIGTLIDSDGEFNGFEVYDYINSIVFRSKTTSALHSFLAKLGRVVPNRTSLGELIAICEEVLNDNPTGMAELDWEFSYKNPEYDKNDPKSKQYIVQCRKMEDFPKNPDGTFNHIVESDADGEKGFARAVIKAHVSNR